MEGHLIIAGLSDIKGRLRTKFPDLVNLEFGLWFTFDGDWLSVHVFQDHQKYLTLALYDRTNNSWRYFLPEKCLSERVTKYGIQRAATLKATADTFNELFKSYGFF